MFSAASVAAEIGATPNLARW